MTRTDREKVLAFRLAGHNLARRLPPGSLLEAAAACGIQNTPPGTVGLALAARVENLTPGEIERAVESDKTLLQSWSIRAAPFFFPTRDAAVFTRGLWPQNEQALRFRLGWVADHLDKVGLGATEAHELTAAAIYEVLDGPALNKGELSHEIGLRLPETLLPWCQGCQVHHVSEIHLRWLGLEGTFCFGPRQGKAPSFVRTDYWLGYPLPQTDPDTARAELLRRYLHCYGPSSVAHFGQWAGIAAEDAAATWRLVEAELAEADFAGSRAWLLESDLASLEAPPPAQGVRLLPPYDPLLALRDRDTLIPFKARQGQIWQALGNPGLVLVEGGVAGLWRPEKKGKRLGLKVELFGPLADPHRAEIEAEASRLAPFKDCQTAQVTFIDG